MLLFLVASGIALIFGVLRVINFAHGAYFTLGAYIGFQASHSFGSIWIAIPVAIVAGLLIGALQEVATFRPIYRYPHAFQLLASVGFALVLEAAIRFCWGLEYKNVNPPALLTGSAEVFGTSISNYRLFVIVVSAAISGGLLWCIDRTSIGLLIRAASSNSDMTECLGIDVDRLRTYILSAGAALAALAGVIAAPLIPVQLGMGTMVLIDCFLVVVLGGLASIKGVLLAALVYGMCQAFGQLLFPTWVQVATYSAALLILVVRPSGLFAARERLA